MRKSTKQKIIVLAIIFIFGMSSIAFFIVGVAGYNTGTETQQTLTDYVVEKELSQQLESTYIQKGVTFMKYYYIEKDGLYNYAGTLPQAMTTSSGQIQLVVERISSDSRRISIDSLYGGSEELASLEQKDVFFSLCNHLSSTPPECALMALNSSLG